MRTSRYAYPRRSTIACLSLSALLSAQLGPLCSGALAQTNPGPVDSGLSPVRGSEEAVVQARSLMDQGDGLMKQNKYAEGSAKYHAAWELHPGYFTACKIGRAESQLKNYPAAASYLAYCIKHFTLSDDAKQKAAEKKYRTLHTDTLKRVGKLVVSLDPKHATLSVDGAALDDELFEGEAFVAPGEHRVSAEASGFVSAEQAVSVAAGAEQRVALRLVAAAPAATPVAKSPTSASEPHPADPSNDVEPPAKDSENSMLARNVVVIGGAVLTVGAIVGSLVFRGKAHSKANDLADLRGDLPPNACQAGSNAACAELDSVQSDREAAGTTSNVLLGLGAGLGVASVLTFLLWPKPEAQRSARRQPPRVDLSLGPRRASLFFQGEF